MNRNFARALALVLKSEGGWSDNPADPGGATMKGITLSTFRAFVKPGGSKADLRAITDDEVAECYRRQYWNVIRGDDLPDGVDYDVFDFAVNSGPSRAAKYLQAVVGAMQDGQIGTATLHAVNGRSAPITINALCDRRLVFLKGLSTWGTFGNGWSSRVASVRSNAIAMVGQPSAPTASPAATPEAKGGLLSALVNLIRSIFGK